MARVPAAIAEFLSGRRIAVAGVSRQPSQAANAIFRKLLRSGYDVFPVNPNAGQVEGVLSYPDVGAIPGALDGVLVATHPNVAAEVVRQCAARGVRQVWFHRSIGAGSVSAEALRECEHLGIRCIVGGCPMMYCEPVDVAHRCMRWWFGLRGRIPR